MRFRIIEKVPEILSLVLLIIGFVIALLTKNAVINYLTILVAGIIIGKLILTKRFGKDIFFYFIAATFAFGYLFGTFNANRIVSFLFLVFGILIGTFIIKNRISKN